jgi:excisionase family DNA binding protein
MTRQVSQETLQEQPLLITVEQTAKLLSLGTTKTWELIAHEGLPVVRLGRAVRVNPKRLEKWVESRGK